VTCQYAGQNELATVTVAEGISVDRELLIEGRGRRLRMIGRRSVTRVEHERVELPKAKTTFQVKLLLQAGSLGPSGSTKT